MLAERWDLLCLVLRCSEKLTKLLARYVYLDLGLPAPLVPTLHTENRSGEALVQDGRYCFLDRHGRPSTSIRILSAC